MVRIGGAITAVVVGILFVWTVVASFDGEGLVVPTGGVTDAGPEDAVPAGETALSVLEGRTRLQDWRADSGPSPKGAAAVPTTGTALEAEDAAAAPAELLESWLATESVNWELLRERPFVEGRVNMPDRRAEILIQAQGRDWRRTHNEEITYGGGWIIFGIGLVLALFLTARGRIEIREGRSGRTIERFTAFERGNHWVTAASFVMLALTGLILLYGQFFLKPWMGASAYSWLASASAYTHVSFMVPFVIGLAVMAVLWFRENWWSRRDFEWLKKGGGFMGHKGKPPSARKFNAGQKIVFWGVILGGLVMIVSGLALMFPFYWFEMGGMQWTMLVHGAVGLLLIGLIIGHIYIGTVGMEGAIDAMWSGQVDRNWAVEHHDLWVAEREGRKGGEER